jgi:peptidoglycan/xylan/chitin deacetylase (PgdA/CDA1 family)
MAPALHVVMYHYIRDLPNTPFPRIKGMLTSAFQQQLTVLQQRYEMATLASALDFLRGTYTPSRDLCLLTFDDGLKEHYTAVAPILADRGIQGLFFVITSCLQEQRVASVHMNHFLMAALDFAQYQQAFVHKLNALAPHLSASSQVDAAIAQRTYRWDTPEVASFKYLLNFVLEADIRDTVVKTLFEEHIATEQAFAPTLYLSWDEVRAMQDAGMLIGGHSHHHQPLATLAAEALHDDLSTCQRLLEKHLRPQARWPFSYPYGKQTTFNAAAVNELSQLGITCAFCTEVGDNLPGTDVFAIRRIDCKDAPQA